MKTLNRIIKLRNLLKPLLVLCGVVRSYFIDKHYRIKEHNPAYDHIFGYRRGWIYRTNYITKFQANIKMLKAPKRLKALSVYLEPPLKNWWQIDCVV